MSLLDSYTEMVRRDTEKKVSEKERPEPAFYLELLCFIGAFGVFFDKFAILFIVYPMWTAYLDYKKTVTPQGYISNQPIEVTNINDDEEPTKENA